MDDLTIALFDIVSYLNDKGIPFVTEGPEVTHGWIGLQCYWCTDTSTHLGVNLTSNWISCWRCGAKGSVAKLVKEIDQTVSFPETLAIMEKYQDFSRLSMIGEVEESIKNISIKIPSHFEKQNWPNIASIVQTFLLRRGFNPETVCRGKELYYGGHIGRFKFRLILPITLRGKLVSWVGRDLTGKATIPYLNLEEEKSVIAAKNTLYGFDEAPPGRNIVVVEGPIDQWKLGPGSVATYGTQWTQRQVALLRELNPNSVFILFDSEDMAQDSAKRLAKQIWWCECEVVELNRVKDPGELSVEQGKELMGFLRSG